MKWIRDAVLDGRIDKAEHFDRRCAQKKFDPYWDPRSIVKSAVRCESREGQDQPEHDGTPWRVIGRDVDGYMSKLGVEAYVRDREKRVVLCSVMDD